VNRWREVRSAAEAALARPPRERDAFLDRACGTDVALRAEVEAQIRACESAEQSNFLAGPAASFAAPLYAELTADAVVAGATDDAADATATDRAELEAALRAALGGRYDVERELGRGGAATVYLARDLRHERQVAIKVLDPSLGATMSGARFLREIRVTAALRHPHILPLHDSGEAAGLLYYVMPFVDGETLRARLTREPVLPIDATLRILRDVAGALANAHRHGVVHRDVKPANILLEEDHAVVADFGIARAVRSAREPRQSSVAEDRRAGEGAQAAVTEAGTSPGTPAYMAPEQSIDGAAIDHRADIYALGVVAYEMLAGTHPFGASSPRDMLAAHRDRAPEPLVTIRSDTPPAIAAVVMRCLEKDPARRPQTAAEILATLESAGAARPNGAGRARRNATRVAVAAVLLLVVSGALAFRALTNRGADRARALRGTNDPAAYDLYLEGRYLWLQRGAENLSRAIEDFQKAVARDPSFARAYAGMALAYGVLPVYVSGATDSATELTIASAQHALALDSTLADAQLALGIALDMRLQFLDALEHYRAAVALDPSSVTAHHWMGFSLLNLGRTDEALVHLRRATELDPLAAEPASAVATALLYARRFGEAEDQSRRALALDSTFAFARWTLGLAQAFGGQPDSAIGTLESGARLQPADSRLSSALVVAYALAGRTTDAERLRARLHAATTPVVDGTEAPVAELVFGNEEPLVAALTHTDGQRRYIDSGGAIGCNPLFDPLWFDARFTRAMRALAVAPCPFARRLLVPQRHDRIERRGATGRPDAEDHAHRR
jgi:tetratricopeptide (TPR) repeat protein/tRNA A-37 threonylcarbamoyl transferase component Bud32